MAITNTWSVTDMQHTDADGGVFLIYWSMEYDASAAGYIAYADLTEADVLGWVYTSLIKDTETAAEAKARIETDRTAKVQKQIDAASSTSDGVPW